MNNENEERKHSNITVPVVILEQMRDTMQRVSALRKAQEKVVGKRKYSMSILVRETLGKHLADWQQELRNVNIEVPHE